MLARIRLAFVHVQLAPLATVSRKAVAYELIDPILASAAIHARIALALVHVAQAPGVEISAGTDAFEAVNQIRTFA